MGPDIRAEDGMRVLIAGSSGLVGKEFLRLLLADERKITAVVALVRRPSGILHPRLSEIVESPERWDRIEAGPLDAGVSCLGTTLAKAGSKEEFRKVDHDLVLASARAARRGGASRFLAVSAMGADPRSSFFYNRVKGETERDLAALGFQSLLIFRPSLLLGDREENRPAEAWAIRLSPLYGPLLTGKLANYRPIPAAKVAASLHRSLTGPAENIRIVMNAEMLS